MYSLCGSFFVFTTLCFEDHSNLLQWCFEAVCNFGKKNFLAWQCAECFDFSNVDDFAFSYAAFDGQDLVVLDELANDVCRLNDVVCAECNGGNAGEGFGEGAVTAFVSCTLSEGVRCYDIFHVVFAQLLAEICGLLCVQAGVINDDNGLCVFKFFG